MSFCPSMGIVMDLCKSVFWKNFLSLHDFWVQKCKNQLFEENKRFECSFFYQIKEQVIANLPCKLEKNTKHLTFRL